MKYNKITIFLALFICLNIGEAHAFFSPTSLQMLSASIGPWMQSLVIAIVAGIISFSFKLKVKGQILIRNILLAGFLIVVVFIGLRFLMLKKLNVMSEPVLIDQLEGLPASRVEEIDNISFEENSLEDKYISIGKLSASEYSQYKKVVLFWRADNEYPLKDAKYLTFDSMWNAMNSKKKEVFFKYLEKINISKKDKLLFLCHAGWRSRIISYFFNQYGYDASYSSIGSINNLEYIDAEMRYGINEGQRIIIDSLKYRENKKYYMFLFGVAEKNYIGKYPDLIKDDKVKDNIKGVESSRTGLFFMRMNYPDFNSVEEEVVDWNNAGIICLNQLHCLLTKNKISMLDQDVEKIYFAGNVNSWIERMK